VSVRETLQKVIRTEGALGPEQALEYFENLKARKRYLEDVY
jgi:sulfite reductase alpha subunit-like flavoprotein